MNFSENIGVTQRVMSELCGLSQTTISRYISQHNIEQIIGSAHRNMRYSIKDSRNIIFDLYSKNLDVKKKVHAFYNFKGGTGKTSICYQVSSHLALMGFRVLVVDADPQGHLSTSFGFDSTQDHLTLYDAIAEGRSLGEVIHNVYEGLDCVPSNLSLTRMEVKLNEMAKREEQISLVFKEVQDNYDFIVFDTNPTISNLNRNIITYADQLNIVCETQPYSLNGLSLLLDDIEKFYLSMRMKKADVLIIPNKYEDRMATSGEAMTALRKHYMELMKPDFAIRKSEDINISAKNGLPLAFFAKVNSNALADIIETTLYILSMSTEMKKKNEPVVGE